jgi:hypothetical protein
MSAAKTLMLAMSIQDNLSLSLMTLAQGGCASVAAWQS